MPEVNLTQVQLNWCMDILARIKIVVDQHTNTEEEKLEAIRWLVKQALKVEREE